LSESLMARLSISAGVCDCLCHRPLTLVLAFGGFGVGVRLLIQCLAACINVDEQYLYPLLMSLNQ